MDEVTQMACRTRFEAALGEFMMLYGDYQLECKNHEEAVKRISRMKEGNKNLNSAQVNRAWAKQRMDACRERFLEQKQIIIALYREALEGNPDQ